MAIVINGTGTIAGVSATGITTAPTNATDASKLPLAGGTMTGNLSFGTNTLFLSANGKIRLGGAQDLEIYHDGSNSYIDERGTGGLNVRSNTINLQKYTGETLATFQADGAVELYHNNVKKFQTESGGARVIGNLQMDGAGNFLLNDNGKLECGNSGDLQIYHNGSSSYIQDNGTGNLHISTNGASIILQTSQGEKMVEGVKDGAANLYHNNVKKIETASDGVIVTGEVNSDGAGFRVKTGSATLGGIFKSGAIEGNSNSDITIFAETGKKIHLCANGSATKVLSVSNSGLLFNGDTAAANALNDYEEGESTITIATASGSVTLKSTHNKCLYTKVGRLVSFNIHIRVDSISSPSGGVNINGLPFTAGSDEKFRASASVSPVYNFSSPSGSMALAWVGNNSTSMGFAFYNGSTQTLNAGGYFQVNTEAYITGSYMTD